MRFITRKVLGVLLVALMFAAPLWSQTGTSAIRGIVTDADGRVVPGANVVLTNVSTNAVRSVKSTDTGEFTFDLITPGQYRLEIEAKGFKKKVVDNVRALVGRRTESDVQLVVGAAGEVIEVRASSSEALVNTQDATLGYNFVSEQISQLPLEARDITALLSLQPGVTREGYVAGARADQSNVTLDGVDINNSESANSETPLATNSLVIGELSSSIIAGPVLRLNAEAIEEFRVTTANANSNQGRSSGAQVNLVTKSGTNEWHGSLFEFHRNTIFTANDWFNNHAGVDRPSLIRNTFGGSVGGPIVKNKVFFFYSYEGRRDAKSTGVSRVVPLPTLGQGIIRYKYCTDPPACSNTQIAQLDAAQNAAAFSSVGLNSAAQSALADAAAKYPANDTSQGDQLNTGGFRFNAPTPVKLNSHVAKLDFNLTKNQTAFVRTNVIYDHATRERWLPDAPSPGTWSHPEGLAVGHTWTIGKNWVNNFRYGYTRQAFTVGGDSDQNDIEFRFVFQPRAFTRTTSRVTPVHNFTDDVSWNKGSHNIQFGTNIRLIRNNRTGFAVAYDQAITNPSFYSASGAVTSNAFQNYLTANGLPGGNDLLTSVSEVQNAATAIIGRFSQYTANFTFNNDGTLEAPGTPTSRSFATQEYDFYVQDTWKLRHNLTLTLGLRYGLARPVYETNGFEVQPTVPLGQYFAERLAAAARGENFTEPIVINRSGPANGGKPMYNWDKNNFQPRIAFAWSSQGGKSVIRGGFAMTNDYYGQALAVNFDLNNTLGFTSNFTTPANTFNVTTRPAPLFTGFGQNVQTLPQVVVPNNLTFPLQQPSDYGVRIESSLDSNLKAPTNYVWNLTYERQLPLGTVLSLSYIGRIGRNLLAQRDITAFNNVKDPKSGMDWYTAGTALEKQRQAGVPLGSIASIPYFDNLFPAHLSQVLDGFYGPGIFNPTWTNTQAFYAFQAPGVEFVSGNDWTSVQWLVDLALDGTGAGPTRFVQPQYGSLSAWSTVANSNYHALTVSLRQRLKGLIMDFNYTWSHSLDNASGLQTANQFDTSPFIVNPIRPRDNYGSSDFDIRHSINANAVWQLPIGKGRAFMSSSHPIVEAIAGGWQLAGVFRWNTGLPQSAPYDDARWATNWNVQSFATETTKVTECPSRPISGSPKLFGACDLNQIYRSFRNAYPGETGERNRFRLPGYVDLDLGLGKTWMMPWSDKQKLQLRWDVFNVTNTQRFGAIDTSRTGFGIGLDPAANNLTAPDDWSNFIQIQGTPRVMQVGLRYSF